MNVIKEIERINQKELAFGIYGGNNKGSWHEKYKNSAWVYVGGFAYELSEGDIICVMSQWGEIEDINLVRDGGTNKSKGFAFIKYEDQRSTILAVDNFNGTKLLGRVLRVDHVDQYKLPKEIREREEERLEENPDADVMIGPGHAYSSRELANEFSINQGQNLWENPSNLSSIQQQQQQQQHPHKRDRDGDHSDDDDHDSDQDRHRHKNKKEKKEKKDKKDKKDKKKKHSEKSKKRKHHDEEEEVDLLKGVLPLPSSQADESLLLPKMEIVTEMTPVTVDITGTLLAPGDVSASWRGRMDPERVKAINDHKERMEKVEKLGPQSKRDEFEGFGGMNRRR